MRMILKRQRLGWVATSTTARACAAAVGVLAVLTLAMVVALWPSGDSSSRPTAPGSLRDATVTKVVPAGCRYAGGDPACTRITFRVEDGPKAGSTAALDMPRAVDVSTGDGIRVVENPIPPGVQPPAGQRPDAYAFSDFRRGTGLLLLAALFVVVVVAVTRWQGVRSLVALALNLGIIVAFAVPAIAAGRAPTLVALAAGLVIVLVGLPISHGVGPKAAAALVGTSLALGITVLLGEVGVRVAHITGFASEEASYLSSVFPDLSVRGLLLAGLIIGALGVLDDLAVTQSSTVMALRKANPALSTLGLFREALVVGKDHIGAVVNTLILAYAGASLPVLMIFAAQGTSFTDAVTSESVAAELVPMLVGSIGLIAAVPLTTIIAALLAVGMPVVHLPDEHTHPH
ncbi:MAG: YibE/F family protein [Thermoleophilia bacterium]|nr:YibE/F family protein [Thermoleophilia bacterium]